MEILSAALLMPILQVNHSGIARQGRYTDGLAADARFEVLGAPYSLLSVSLSASQKLFTRRGTLVAVSGKSENVSILQYIYQPSSE
jgi:hypothetical protein